MFPDVAIAKYAKRVEEGAELARKMKQAGITQGDVAARADVTQGAVSKVLTGGATSRNIKNTIMIMLREVTKQERAG